jgi:histidyl-tRNA synthetase
MESQRCKGTRDLLPEDMARFRHIEGAFRSCCLSRGYQEVRTPTLEYLYLFTSTGTLTPNMLSRVYSFLDWDGWSGERVVLRPDGTISTVRLYLDSLKEQELAKLFYITNIFAFEETGKETRERWQCGAEIIGGAQAVTDVELMLLAREVLTKLGFNGVELRLSHAGLLRALLGELGLDAAEQSQVFDGILDGNVKALAEIELRDPELKRLLSLLLETKGSSKGFVKNLKLLLSPALPGLEPSLDDFLGVLEMLDEMGTTYQIDIASGKGFEYYTGVFFQLFAQGEKIGGGGRYDDLVPLMGGRNTPAAGFALYIDQLMSRLERGPSEPPAYQRVLVKAERSDPAAWKAGFEIAAFLREAGYVAELDLGAREVSNWRWVISLQGETFLLADQNEGEERVASSAAEVLKLMEELRCR